MLLPLDAFAPLGPVGRLSRFGQGWNGFSQSITLIVIHVQTETTRSQWSPWPEVMMRLQAAWDLMTTVRSRILPRGTVMSGRELRTRLVNIEAGQHDSLDETRTRLVNIEARLERMRQPPDTGAPDNTAFSRFEGHPDQGFGHLTYSQFGEDLMVANIFNLLAVDRPTYLDVGANDPIAGSNTALLYARGSRGVAVEANPNYLALWRDVRPEDVLLNVGIADEPGQLPFHYFSEWSGRNTFMTSYARSMNQIDPRSQVQNIEMIKTVRLDDIVEKHLGGQWPDFLTIDIEGLDYAVLKGARFGKTHPIVLCIETRDGAGNDEFTLFRDVLKTKGYVPVFRTWGNLLAVHRDAVATLKL
jgi:FkbM family methyltransferase